MKNYLSAALLIVITTGMLSACSKSESKTKAGDKADNTVVMYKNPGCECCTHWAQYLEANGYKVEERPIDDMYSFKYAYKVPNDLQSCHTAVIDGYVVEGHVPVTEINRLLKERPDAKGIAVPGMPTGSPGMEIPGRPNDHYNVLLFKEDGSRQTYASY